MSNWGNFSAFLFRLFSTSHFAILIPIFHISKKFFQAQVRDIFYLQFESSQVKSSRVRSSLIPPVTKISAGSKKFHRIIWSISIEKVEWKFGKIAQMDIKQKKNSKLSNNKEIIFKSFIFLTEFNLIKNRYNAQKVHVF